MGDDDDNSSWILNSSNSLVQNDVPVEKFVVVTVMVIVDTVAFLANMSILAAILITPYLRHTLTNFFVLNLCVIDLLCSVISMPVNIRSFYVGYWQFGQEVCEFSGFFNSFLAFASTASLCVISIERFYSIRHPMHHAANMTLLRTVAVIIFVWIFSLGFSLMPIIGWNSYVYRPHGAHCSFTWDTSSYHSLYIIIVCVLCFVVPGCVLILMYSGIFHVAKKAATQTHPGATHQISTDCSSTRKSHPLDVQSASVQAGTQRTSKGHYKAAKTLVIILLTYITLWGPYFVVHMYGAVHGAIPHGHVLEITATWLAFSSYAANPFLYGLLNRSIREELVKSIPSSLVSNCSTQRAETPDNDHPEGNEDFFQFLERTSCATHPSPVGA